MKKSSCALAAMFVMAAGAAQAGEATPASCSSDSARVPRIEELDRQSTAPGQALAIIVGLEEGSALWDRMRRAPEGSYGALLNEVAPDSIVFDPDTSRKLTDAVPIVYVYGCLRGGASLIGALDDLKAVDGVAAAAPDTLLFPVPVLPGGGTTPAPRP